MRKEREGRQDGSEGSEGIGEVLMVRRRQLAGRNLLDLMDCVKSSRQASAIHDPPPTGMLLPSHSTTGRLAPST